jgi:hypothetical protein
MTATGDPETPPPAAPSSTSTQTSAAAWSQSYNPPPTQSGPSITGQELGNLIAPPVPSSSASSSGSTVVNTPSLDAFASNIGALINPVKDAYSKLLALPAVAPGQFYQAYQIQNKVNGAQGSSGGSGTDLTSSYTAVLNDLADGLTSIQTAAQQMSAKYTTTNDLNNMKASDLQTDLDSAQSEFGSMMSANGGAGGDSGTSTNGGTGSGSGTSKTPSSTGTGGAKGKTGS